MKKIINGKKYDTETAKEIVSWSNNYAYNDFGYCEETLYQKKTGEFFLYGYGNAMSKYRESYGENSWGSGENIKPMTEKEVKEWLEDVDEPDVYIQLFGEVEE